MRFNISGFTHIGTKREINQDRILIQDSIIKTGIHSFWEVKGCFCFVADGIGGESSGEFAAEFVLKKVSKKISRKNEYTQNELIDIFSSINRELIEFGHSNPDYLGTGTTLVGIIIQNDKFEIINAGDSPAYVFRNNTIIKLTEDQVHDPLLENSPITSYFGGKINELHLNFDTILRTILVGDIIVLASDGLLKSISVKQVKAILSNSKPLNKKSEFILNKALEIGAEDNVSSILIEVTESEQ